MINLKYMGSKSRIAKYIVPIIQSYIDKTGTKIYYEPFVGGANIIDKIKCGLKIGCDKNRYLIALLNKAKNNPEDLYDAVPKDLYDKARDEYNSGNITSFEDWQIGNIGFLASYNGRFFDGGYAKPGYEKTKTGERYRDYYQEAKRNLIEQSSNLNGLNGSVFFTCDYHECPINNAVENMVIYCDPPYAGTKQFKNATHFDYDEFWNHYSKLSKNNIVLVSELSAPDDWICIWEKSVNRSIKANDKSRATEKLFIHKCNAKE